MISVTLQLKPCRGIPNSGNYLATIKGEKREVSNNCVEFICQNMEAALISFDPTEVLSVTMKDTSPKESKVNECLINLVYQVNQIKKKEPMLARALKDAYEYLENPR